MLVLLFGGASVGLLLATGGRMLRGAGAGGGNFEALEPFLTAGGGADVRRASGARLGAALGRTLPRPRVGLIESLRATPDARID